MKETNPLARVIKSLRELGEADISALTARSGVDRALTQACLDQLVRIGKIRVMTHRTSNTQGSCTLGCCGVVTGDVQARSIPLYRIV